MSATRGKRICSLVQNWRGLTSLTLYLHFYQSFSMIIRFFQTVSSNTSMVKNVNVTMPRVWHIKTRCVVGLTVVPAIAESVNVNLSGSEEPVRHHAPLTKTNVLIRMIQPRSINLSIQNWFCWWFCSKLQIFTLEKKTKFHENINWAN